jgi:HD-like signal output (HDOD) protein
MNNIQRCRVALLHRCCMSCDGLAQDFGRDNRAYRISAALLDRLGYLTYILDCFEIHQFIDCSL